MNEQALNTNLDEWILSQTRSLDVVASYETFNDCYDALRFTDPIADNERIEEYKWIIKQMNSFLTVMRKSLLSCKDINAIQKYLMNNITPKGQVNLDSRKALAYQKLRQRWVMNLLGQVSQIMEQSQEERQ